MTQALVSMRCAKPVGDVLRANPTVKGKRPNGAIQFRRPLWQSPHDLGGAHAQFDDAQNQIENISRIIVLACPGVRVVYDDADSQAEDIIVFSDIRHELQ